MQFSRRAFEIGGIGVVLALCATAFGQPLLLFGAAGVGAWLLGRQRAFVAAAERMDESLTITQQPASSGTSVDRELPVAVRVDFGDPTPLALTVEPKRPLAATLTESSTATIETAGTQVDLTYAVEFHVAGRHELPPVEITLRDEYGLFEETIERGPTTSVVVSSRGPSQLHVGRGASDRTEEFGAASRQTTARGLEPQEVREYVPGDIARNIDWNVTARLGDLHVREYGMESDRHVLVVVDQREAMAVGPPGETKFDYAREVALGFLESVESAFDSVALYGVDDDAVAARYSSQSATQAAGMLRGPLIGLQPKAQASQSQSQLGSHTGSGTARSTPTAARRLSALSRSRVAGRLGDDTSPFDRKLGPYLSAPGRIDVDDEDPIRAAVRKERMVTDDEFSVVILTDDTDPKRLWDLVQYCRGTVDQVMLFLTPHVLFEPGGLDDLETAYERYLEFEEFRRELDGLPNVTAFEVGPGDRLDAIINARRETA